MTLPPPPPDTLELGSVEQITIGIVPQREISMPTYTHLLCCIVLENSLT
jgi:hypothetical protein